MKYEQLEIVEREVLELSGVWEKREENGRGGIGVTGYRFGRRQIGHAHDEGNATFRFPREVRDELNRSGRGITRPANLAEKHATHRGTEGVGRSATRILNAALSATQTPRYCHASCPHGTQASVGR